MVLLTLDDRDPNILYSNGWNHAGSALEFNKTTTWTAVAGSTAKITFQGTGIGVFGTIGKGDRKSIAPVSAYSIDGGAPIQFTAVQRPIAQTSQQFFQSGALPDGAHTLTITNTLASDPLFLDFLMVLADSETVTPTSTSASSTDSSTSSSVISTSSSASPTSSSSTSSSSFTSSSSSTSSTSLTTPLLTSSTPVPTFTVTSTSDPSTTSPATSADSATGATKKSSNSGAIAGGIIAAIVGVIIIIFALLFWYRRHKRQNEFRDMDSDPDRFWAPVAHQPSNNSSSSAQPFNLGPAPPPRSTATPTPMAQAQTGASYDTSYGFEQARYPGGYMPAEAYNNSAYASRASPAPGYAPSNHGSYYGQGQLASAPAPTPAQPYPQNQNQLQGYPSRAYVPPSQLLSNWTA